MLNPNRNLQKHSGLTLPSISSLPYSPAPPSFGLPEVSYLPEIPNDDISPFDQW